MSEDNAEINQESSRGKVMGILAIILAGFATFIPFLGVYLTVVAAILAAFSYGKSALFGYIAIGINFFSLFFFSPMLWIAAGADAASATDHNIAGLVWFLLGAQVLALVFLIWKGRKKKAD